MTNLMSYDSKDSTTFPWSEHNATSLQQDQVIVGHLL
jgi:hypothetical protein